MVKSKTGFDLVDVVVAKKAQQSVDERKINTLINLLLKVASDLKNNVAVEGDFNIEITEHANFNEFNLSLQTYHVKQEDAKSE